MFSLKSWFKGQRPPADDELISAYIDGVLDDSARRAFEARMSAEPDLKRRVDVTRRLVAVAAQLPPVRAPRNFTLPASARKPAAPGVMWWRLGSAVAAAVFVFSIGLDLSGVLAPGAATPRAAAPIPASAPQAAKLQAVEPTSAPAAAAGAAQSETAATAAPQPTEAASINSAAAPTGTPGGTPVPKGFGAGAITQTADMSASASSLLVAETETPSALRSKQPLSNTDGVSTTAEETQAFSVAQVAQPSATESPSESLTAPATPTEQPTAAQPFAGPTWLLVLTGVSLILAVGLGIAGWVRR